MARIQTAHLSHSASQTLLCFLIPGASGQKADFDSVRLGGTVRVHISSEAPGDVKAAGKRTTL